MTTVGVASVGTRGSLSALVVLELVLSPFWGIGALVTMVAIPDQVLLRASCE